VLETEVEFSWRRSQEVFIFNYSFGSLDRVVLTHLSSNLSVIGRTTVEGSSMGGFLEDRAKHIIGYWILLNIHLQWLTIFSFDRRDLFFPMFAIERRDAEFVDRSII
jgi:hypothetical protein